MIIGLAFTPLLNIRYKPGRDLPQLEVRYAWPNASPKVIEQEATKIEGLLSKIGQIKSIESYSDLGSGRVLLLFDKSVDINEKRYEVSSMLRQLRHHLPRQMSTPEIYTNSAEQGQSATFMVLTINASASTREIKKETEKIIKPGLLKVKGISDISIYGATPMQWEICYQPALLKNYNISPDDIKATINQLGEQQFLGNHLDASNALVPLLSSTQAVHPQDWGRLPIVNRAGRVIRLSDVATIKYKEQAPSSYYRINGKNALNIVIGTAKDENQIRIARQIQKQLKFLENNLPLEYSIKVSYDSTQYITEELNKIAFRTILSLLILLIFVVIVSRSLRILAVLFISLTANLLISVIFYYLFKVEIHIYSLAGITVSFGIIIDNSIIMVSHLQQKKGLRIFIALLAATLTTLGALSIVFFLKENQKLLLLDFTYVMFINFSISLVVALLLVPALMERLVKNQIKTLSVKTLRAISQANQFYCHLINFGKRLKWAFILLAILGFGIPIGHLPNEIKSESKLADYYNKTLGSKHFTTQIRPVLNKLFGGSLRLFTEHVIEGSFYSEPGRTTLFVYGRMPEGCTIHQLNQSIRKMEQYISQFEEIEQFETRINSYKYASINILFNKTAENTAFPFYLKEQIESKAQSLGGMDWRIYGVGDAFSNALHLGQRDSHILLTGYNYDQLYHYAKSLEGILLKNQRVENTEITSSESWRSTIRIEYNLDVDKNKLAYSNMSYRDYTNSFFTQLYSGYLKPYYNDSELQNVVLKSSDNLKYNRWQFYNIPVRNTKGYTKLSNAGKITKKQSGQVIYKKNQVYQMFINYNFIGPGKLAKRYQEKTIESFNKTLPLGYKVKKTEDKWWSWDNKEKKQYWLLVLVVAIIYFITAILFESLAQPLIVICLIPLSFIGVFLTFYLFDFNFDQGGFASFILLSGLVVNAAIYIINDFNKLTTHLNKPPSLSLFLKAFNHNITAISLTILSTVLGLIPFIVGDKKEVFWFAFAVGAMGGLIISLIAIIIYLPLFLKFKS
jgi:multidrug efflux pump subunit AcrB